MAHQFTSTNTHFKIPVSQIWTLSKLPSILLCNWSAKYYLEPIRNLSKLKINRIQLLQVRVCKQRYSSKEYELLSKLFGHTSRYLSGPPILEIFFVDQIKP